MTIATFVEARPQVQLLLVLRLLVGNVLGQANGGLDVAAIVTSDASWLLASLAVYVLNGLSDVDGDRRNGSRRPLAAGRLSVGAATAMVGALSACALCLAVFRGPLAVLMLSAFLALGAAYSFGPFPLKDRALTASVTVGVACAVTYVFGAVAAQGTASGPTLVVVASGMGAWMLVAGNAKDFGDEEGDRLAGRRTLPLVLGDRRARLVLSVMVMILGASATAAGVTTRGADPLVLLIVAAVAMASVWWNADAARRRPRAAYQIFMWSQFAVNLALICGAPAA